MRQNATLFVLAAAAYGQTSRGTVQQRHPQHVGAGEGGVLMLQLGCFCGI
jgi:hypothetical protein